MSSTTIKNIVFECSNEENQRDENVSINGRSSIVARQISFSQEHATFGEIILVILPYLILLIDIFFFFLLRGFKLTTFDQSILPDSKSDN